MVLRSLQRNITQLYICSSLSHDQTHTSSWNLRSCLAPSKRRKHALRARLNRMKLSWRNSWRREQRIMTLSLNWHLTVMWLLTWIRFRQRPSCTREAREGNWYKWLAPHSIATVTKFKPMAMSCSELCLCVWCGGRGDTLYNVCIHSHLTIIWLSCAHHMTTSAYLSWALMMEMRKRSSSRTHGTPYGPCLCLEALTGASGSSSSCGSGFTVSSVSVSSSSSVDSTSWSGSSRSSKPVPSHVRVCVCVCVCVCACVCCVCVNGPFSVDCIFLYTSILAFIDLQWLYTILNLHIV